MAGRLNPDDLKMRKMWRKHPLLLNQLTAPLRTAVLLRYGLGPYRVHSYPEIRAHLEVNNLLGHGANVRGILVMANLEGSLQAREQEINAVAEQLPPATQLDPDLSLEVIELGLRSYNVLKRTGLSTINQVLAHTADQLMLKIVVPPRGFLKNLRRELADLADQPLYLRGEQPQS